ncbi:MAG: GNAT family N-acetyltransferase [Chitinophagales bacterium]|nr:GNAT family N-acetyltransferase [Chitinophagales bacterium]
MSLEFTDATINDADALLSLIHQLEHFIPKDTLLNNLKRNTEDKNYRIFVAKLNNQVIAFAELCFTQFIHEPNPRARLTSFCVDEAFRNKKTGAAFLAFIEGFCRSQNYLRIELTSKIHRIDAHRFYENNGYSYASKRFYKEL